MMWFLQTGFLFLLAFPAAQGKAHLWVRFRRFDNPGGRGDNGHCCDGKFSYCPSKCDHRFIICLDFKYGRSDTSSCPYGKVATGEITDKDSITFGEDIGGIKNPMIFDFDSWPGRVLMKIGVWDVDDNGDDFVDFLKQEADVSPAPSMTEASVQRLTVRNRVTLRVDIMVFCGPDSYGPTCATTCSPKSDSTSGYTCDLATGRKICREGWTGDECDISIDECLINKCQRDSTCVDGHMDYTCVCAPGYAGRFCETNVNECLSYPCLNQGTCEDRVNGYTCTCSAGWTGDTCGVRDECMQNTCYHNGICFNVNQTFICKCPEGFAGATCEIDLDECVSSPCANGGSCENAEGSFQCQCQPGWTGALCEIDINECDPNPCVHELACINLFNNFSCICLPGYTGRFCEQDIDECLSQQCLNEGVCTNLQPSYRCTCPRGFQGRHCETDVDECNTAVCRQGGACINSVGSFYCLCPPDYTGLVCETRIDHCMSQPCLNGGTCVDVGQDFQCTCTSSWRGRMCDKHVDRCLQSPCTNGGTCLDEGVGQHRLCYCPGGWEGELCERDRNECHQSPCDNGGTCVNTPGGFLCACVPGWTGPLCQTDVNECLDFRQQDVTSAPGGGLWRKKSQDQAPDNRLAGTARPACMNGGKCENVDGGYLCACSDAWTGPRCEEDADECLVQPCRNGAECHNLPGAFSCTCSGAWTGKLCESDVDECESVRCKAPATCVNTPGGFACQCPCGLTGDACRQDLDECAGEVKNSSCPGAVPPRCSPGGTCMKRSALSCQNGGTCLNTFGSFACACPTGFTGSACETDIDECAGAPADVQGQGISDAMEFKTASPKVPGTPANALSALLSRRKSPCANGTVCQNLPGSFACVCPPGWTGAKCQSDINECLSNPCQRGGTCLNIDGRFRCTCPEARAGRLCEVDSERCKDRVCQNNATCVPRDALLGGGVQCVCTRGWEGPHCDLDRNECVLHPCQGYGACVNEKGGFRCQCSEGNGTSCANTTAARPDITLPLYLNGPVRSNEIVAITEGVNRFLEDYGGFKKDFNVRTVLQTQEAYDKEGNDITQLAVNIIVENVTLSSSDVLEIMNRIPAKHFESYLPLQLYMGKASERVGEPKNSFLQSLLASWYIYPSAAVLAACVGAMIVLVCKRRGKLPWSRKRSDASIMFMRNGMHSPGFDPSVETDPEGSEVPARTFEPGSSTLERSFAERDSINPRPWSVEISFPSDWRRSGPGHSDLLFPPTDFMSSFFSDPMRSEIGDLDLRLSTSFLGVAGPSAQEKEETVEEEEGTRNQYSVPETGSNQSAPGFDNVMYVSRPSSNFHPRPAPRPHFARGSLPPPPIIVPVTD